MEDPKMTIEMQPLLENQDYSSDEDADLDDDDFVLIEAGPEALPLAFVIELPDEVVIRIFRYLQPRELGRLSSVCSAWNRLSQDDVIWAARYREAKEEHALESTNNLSSAKFRNLYNSMSWKQRYRDTFHIPKSIFWGSSASDGVQFNLDNDVIFADEQNTLTGEIMLTIASERLETHGVYIYFHGVEYGWKKQGKHDYTKTRAIVETHIPIVGTETWNNRKKQLIPFNKGSYHFPFSVDFPRQAIQGGPLPDSYMRTGGGYRFKVHYEMAVILVRPVVWNLYSDKRDLHLLPYSDSKQREILESLEDLPRVADNHTHDYLFGGNTTFSVELPRRSLQLGETLIAHVRIDNRRSPNAISRIEVRVHEHMLFPQTKIEASTDKARKRFPCLVAPGEVKEIDIEYPVSWNQIQGRSMINQSLLRQYYSLIFSLGVSFPATNPTLHIPVVLLDLLSDKEVDSFADVTSTFDDDEEDK